MNPLLTPNIEHLPFIDKPSDVLHVDINSCFATVEQQCNSLLRGRAVVVAAYASAKSCILSPSIEAKRYGIKTGMSVREAQKIYPGVVVLSTDPAKYRWINRKLVALCADYTPHFEAKSIDEVVLHLANTPSMRQSPLEIGWQLKQRIRQEIGEWMSVSVGAGPNRWLAKMAAGLQKPDGLEELQWWNIESALSGMKLVDLHGISRGNTQRLYRQQIYQPIDMYRSSISQLRIAFQSVLGFDWAAKMHGYEVDDYIQQRKSVSHEYSLPRPARNIDELRIVLSKLCQKLSYRLNGQELAARSLFVGLMWQDYQFWHQQQRLTSTVHSATELQHYLWQMIRSADAQPEQPIGWPVRKLSIGCINLEPINDSQLSLWQGDKQRQLRLAVDKIQTDFGSQAIGSARGLEPYPVDRIPDFVAFGRGGLEG